MRVWVTRTQPGADATAKRVRGLGHNPIVAPVLEVRTLRDTSHDLSDVAALAFTSSNAVAALAEQIPVEEGGFGGLPVFAVGGATAAAARRAGFRDVRSADGDVVTLERLIVRSTGEIDGCLLHPCGADLAGNLAGTLAERGIAARAAPIYETVAIDVLPRLVAKVVDAGALEAVLLHSTKAARVVAGLLAHTQLASVAALGLSQTCVTPIESLGFGRIAAAAEPNETALLALLKDQATG